MYRLFLFLFHFSFISLSFCTSAFILLSIDWPVAIYRSLRCDRCLSCVVLLRKALLAQAVCRSRCIALRSDKLRIELNENEPFHESERGHWGDADDMQCKYTAAPPLRSDKVMSLSSLTEPSIGCSIPLRLFHTLSSFSCPHC